MKKLLILGLLAVLFFLILFILYFYKPIFLKGNIGKFIYSHLYPKPMYLYKTGSPFARNPGMRCLCYGEVKESEIDHASDPPSYSYCSGWVDENSCELETSDGWSRDAYTSREINIQKEKDFQKEKARRNIPGW